MKIENNVIHLVEFEMGQILDLRIEIFQGRPMFSIWWKGQRLENNIEYGPVMAKFGLLKKVLWDIYGWAFCEECRKMEYGVKTYTLTYDVGTKVNRALCPKFLSGYKTAMERDVSDIIRIEEVMSE